MNGYASASPIDAASRAIDQVRRHLFPVRLERWLALGLVAFLDQCGRGGGGGGGGQNFSGGNGDASEAIQRAAEWVGQHIVLVVILAVAALVLIVALTALVLWLNSRGTFMYIDNVATGRADVVRPWREHKRHADSYFLWRFGLALAALGAVIVIVAPIVIAAVSIARHGVQAWALAIIVIAVLSFLLIAVIVGLFSLVLRDFVAPIQLQTGDSCGAALRRFRSLAAMNLGALVVYVVLKIVYVFAVGIAILTLTCVTCCMALCCLVLPVISQTLLQPLHYFERAWSLQLLASMGHDLMQGFPQSGPVDSLNSTI